MTGAIKWLPHTSYPREGDFYVSCADFADPQGRKLALDFLVIPSDHGLVATQAIIHAADGKQRAYQLED